MQDNDKMNIPMIENDILTAVLLSYPIADEAQTTGVFLIVTVVFIANM